MRAASASTYALTTHSRLPGVTPSSRWIDGSATFTIVLSSRIIACPRHIATSVSRRLRGSSGGMARGDCPRCPLGDATAGSTARNPGGSILPAAAAEVPTQDELSGLGTDARHAERLLGLRGAHLPAQLELLDLPGARLRQLVEHHDPLGHLEPREALAREGDELVGVDVL